MDFNPINILHSYYGNPILENISKSIFYIPSDPVMMISLAPTKLVSSIKIKVYLISKIGECSPFGHVAMTFSQCPLTLQ